MNLARRSKFYFLSAAVLVTVLVILWGSYIFTAMWLRVRCVRELANQARPLDEIALVNPTAEAVGITTAQAFQDVTLALQGAGSNGSDLLRRLEELQQPSVHTVLRNLLGWNKQDQSTQQLGLVQSITFTQAQAANGQSNALSTTIAADLTLTQAAVSVNAGQAIRQVIFWDSLQSNRVYSLTDSRGERIIVVVGSDYMTSDEGQQRELLIIDSAGQILDRSLVRDIGLIGRLSEPLGRADQLVFGKTGYFAEQDGTLRTVAVGPVSVRIIERGKWKTVQTIELPASAETGNQTESSSLEESP